MCCVHGEGMFCPTKGKHSLGTGPEINNSILPVPEVGSTRQHRAEEGLTQSKIIRHSLRVSDFRTRCVFSLILETEECVWQRTLSLCPHFPSFCGKERLLVTAAHCPVSHVRGTSRAFPGESCPWPLCPPPHLQLTKAGYGSHRELGNPIVPF